MQAQWQCTKEQTWCSRREGRRRWKLREFRMVAPTPRHLQIRIALFHVAGDLKLVQQVDLVVLPLGVWLSSGILLLHRDIQILVENLLVVFIAVALVSARAIRIVRIAGGTSLPKQTIQAAGAQETQRIGCQGA